MRYFGHKGKHEKSWNPSHGSRVMTHLGTTMHHENSGRKNTATVMVLMKTNLYRPSTSNYRNFPLTSFPVRVSFLFNETHHGFIQKLGSHPGKAPDGPRYSPNIERVKLL